MSVKAKTKEQFEQVNKQLESELYQLETAHQPARRTIWLNRLYFIGGIFFVISSTSIQRAPSDLFTFLDPKVTAWVFLGIGALLLLKGAIRLMKPSTFITDEVEQERRAIVSKRIVKIQPEKLENNVYQLKIWSSNYDTTTITRHISEANYKKLHNIRYVNHQELMNYLKDNK